MAPFVLLLLVFFFSDCMTAFATIVQGGVAPYYRPFVGPSESLGADSVIKCVSICLASSPPCVGLHYDKREDLQCTIFFSVIWFRFGFDLSTTTMQPYSFVSINDDFKPKLFPLQVLNKSPGIDGYVYSTVIGLCNSAGMKLPAAAQSEWMKGVYSSHGWIYMDIMYTVASGFYDSFGNAVNMTYTPVFFPLPTDNKEYCCLLKYGNAMFQDCANPFDNPDYFICVP